MIWAIRIAFLVAFICGATWCYLVQYWGLFGFWMFAIGEWWGKAGHELIDCLRARGGS